MAIDNTDCYNVSHADYDSSGCVITRLGDGTGGFLDAIVNPIATILIVLAVVGFIGGLLYVFKEKI